MGGKGGGGTNVAAAQQQAAADQAINAQQTWANRPTMTTPWGQQTWQAGQGTDPATGKPITTWSSNISLTPAEQQALNSQQHIQQGRSDFAENLLGQAGEAYQKPFDWGALPAAPTGTMDAADQAYQRMVGYAQPTRERQQQQLETKLLNMGAARGGEAFKNATQDQSDQFARENQAFQQAAGAEGRADIGTQEQLRQQAIAEQMQKRGMTLNDLNALLSGEQVQMPGMPDFKAAGKSAAPDLLGASQADQAAAQANKTDWGAIAGTVGGIALVAV